MKCILPFICLVSFVLSACSSDGVGVASCVTGRTLECACPGAAPGSQTCLADGTFSACSCDGGDATDGGDGNTTNDVASGPGSITAEYSLFPKTCGDLGLSQIRARATHADGTIESESAVLCVNEGSVLLDPITPGNYVVTLDGLSDEATPRVTHSARLTDVVVTSGDNTVTPALSPVALP